MTELGQYAKEALPFDRVFAKMGEPSVVRSRAVATSTGANSYEDNVVVYADPVENAGRPAGAAGAPHRTDVPRSAA